MKMLRGFLCFALVFVIMSTVVLACAIYTVDAPVNTASQRETVVDYGVDGDPKSTQIYIQPYQIGPGKYVYAYVDDHYSSVFIYRDDLRQKSVGQLGNNR